MPVLHFVVPPEWDQKPLSAFLRGAHQLSGTTLRAARRIEGGLTLDGAFIRTVDPVRAGATVAVYLPDSERGYRPYAGSLEAPVLYEDSDLLILNKPAGMPCHPSKGHPNDTLANLCAGLPAMAGRAFRPIGRLDRDTSGAVLCAKHPHSAAGWGFPATGRKRPISRCSAALPVRILLRSMRLLPATGRGTITAGWCAPADCPPSLTAASCCAQSVSALPRCGWRRGGPIRSGRIWHGSAARWRGMRSTAGTAGPLHDRRCTAGECS